MRRSKRRCSEYIRAFASQAHAALCRSSYLQCRLNPTIRHLQEAASGARPLLRADRSPSSDMVLPGMSIMRRLLSLANARKHDPTWGLSLIPGRAVTECMQAIYNSPRLPPPPHPIWGSGEGVSQAALCTGRRYRGRSGRAAARVEHPPPVNQGQASGDGQAGVTRAGGGHTTALHQRGRRALSSRDSSLVAGYMPVRCILSAGALLVVAGIPTTS